MPELRLATACLAAVCAHGFFTGAKLALSVLALQRSQAPAMLGVVMMAAALLPALLSPHIGRLADRHGVRRLLQASLGGLVVLALVLWWVPAHLAVLIAAAALLGLGFNAFAVGIQKLIGGLPPARQQQGLAPAALRKQNFGTLATVTSVSAFAGPLLAGWALDHLPTGAVFGLLALLPLVACLLSLGWKLPTPAVLPEPAASAQPANRRPLLLERPMWPLASAIVLLTLAGDVLIFLSPVIGQQQGLSATVVGAIVSAAAVGGFAVRLASGLFIARLPEWPYIAATLLACAALLLLCTQAASATAFLLLSFLLGAFLGLAQPMTQSLLHLAVPEARVGEALGARLALVGGAQAAGPLLLGLGAQQLGIGATLALAALVLGVGGLSALRTAATLRARRTR